MSEPVRGHKVWGKVPARNMDFTGRAELLEKLRRNAVGGAIAVVPTALHGLGGVGKTQLAIEFAHRHKGDYDVVWWIPSDQAMLIPAAIARLAPHLGVSDADATDVDEIADAVVDKLRRGEPFDRWLLVFDNANDPETILRFVPDGPGNVLITSRDRTWDDYYQMLTVDVFAREESRAYLTRRVPGIGAQEADTLAEELGDLPLALAQAAALQSQTGMPVEEYLSLLRTQTGRLLAEGRPRTYDLPLTATWTLLLSRLREEHADSVELLNLLAFFGADPIPRSVLSAGGRAVEEPLAGILRDPIRLSRALGALGRYALVQIDRADQTVEVHRLVQALLREEVGDAGAGRYRDGVRRLLAAAPPVADPDDHRQWHAFARLLPHVRPSQAVASPDRAVRFLMRAVVRYLYLSGDASAAGRLAAEIVEAWSADAETDAEDLCAMKRHHGIALRVAGRFREAFELHSAVLREAADRLGDDHPETLQLKDDVGTALRAIGRFDDAYELDFEAFTQMRRVFGESHRRTLGAQTSVALDLALTSRYAEAEEMLKGIYEAMRDVYGTADHQTAQIVLNNLTRMIRLRGAYTEACELGEDLYAVAAAMLGDEHPTTLKAANDLAIAVRNAEGGSAEAVERAERLVQRYERRLGDHHPDRLAAQMTLINAYRAAGRAEDAVSRAELVTLALARTYGPDHPYTHACRGNLALLLHRTGRAAEAREIFEVSAARLDELLGPGHHYTLVCTAGLAGALADLDDPAAAAECGERTLRGVRTLFGPDHPMTHGVAANLALDLTAAGRSTPSAGADTTGADTTGADTTGADTTGADTTGRDAAGRDARLLRDGALAGLRVRLGGEHPVVAAAEAGDRVDFDFDPPPI